MEVGDIKPYKIFLYILHTPILKSENKSYFPTRVYLPLTPFCSRKWSTSICWSSSEDSDSTHRFSSVS